jgi:DNA ligase D-like protein (predicted polymerase)
MRAMRAMRSEPSRRSKAAAARIARGYAPQLAVPVERPPAGRRWLHELELDGHRAGAAIAGGAVRLASPAGGDLDAELPELVDALARLPVRSALLDGAIVVLDEQGRPSLQRLHDRARSRAGLAFFAFDLLQLDGEDLTGLPLVERKRRLAAALAGGPPALRLSEPCEVDGADMFATACRLGAVGVVSKRRDARYQAGRASSWQTCRCQPRQELIVGGAFPRIGISRPDLARFYERIAPWALPHLAGRPLTLVRCRRPVTADDALRSQCAFLHHTREEQGELPGVPRLPIPEQRKVGDYTYIDGLPALLALIAGGVIELHQWNARVDDVERPDRLVLDLDPGEGTAWSDVLRAARRVRARLDELGLASWPRTTGGKGLHVVVPFRRGPTWDEVYAVSRALAEQVAAGDPGLTTAFGRRDRAGKVLIDFKRNLRPAAPVAVPVAWREVGARLGGDRWTVLDLPRRLDRLRADPWAGIDRCDQLLDVAGIVGAARGSRRARAASLKTPTEIDSDSSCATAMCHHRDGR